ncbi:MAG: hypothetical protein QOH57_1411 [Mycobacterium sp.]|jgi:hypothetical protein|nr:hypothetical protein [Mycobacterium sp.]
MLIAGVICLCAAAAIAALGARALARPAAAGTQQVLRAVAPTQLAAAAMLAAGGIVALSGRPSVGLLVLCAAGAVGTIAAGLWQGTRYARALIEGDRGCAGAAGGSCASCTLPCR